jgi:hypothetical protein
MSDVYTAEILGVIAGQPCASVLHFQAAEDSVEDPVEVATELIAAIHGGIVAGTYLKEYLDMVPENYTLKGIRARRINNTGGPNVAMPANNEAGNRTGNADVSGVGPVILWHCLSDGEKWVTGKLFVPGVSVDDVAENVFSDTLLAATGTFGALFDTPIGAGPHGPYAQVIWSPSQNLPLDIISHSNSLKVGTQRRRYVPL